MPFAYFAVGAGSAVVASFMVLGVLWRSPKLQEGAPVRVRRPPRLPTVLALGRILLLAGLVLVVVDGVISAGGRRHIGPVLVWVWLWLVLPFIAALVADPWRWISPWRVIVPRSPAREGPSVGIWPAAAAFVALTWLELVWTSTPRALAVAVVLFIAWIVVWARVLGRDRGLATADAFEGYLGILGAMAPFRIAGADTVERPGFLRGLPRMPVVPGTTWFVVALIGTVTYDGLSGTTLWSDLWGSVARDPWFGTAALLGTVVVIGAAFHIASWAAARLGGGEASTTESAADFVHTLVPIAFAYAFAHYFTLVLYEGQLLIHSASDPFGLGWDIFGTADWFIVFFLSPTAVWWVQVVVIVAGHVAATVLAHDRALARFGPTEALRTQYAMLALMVALTSLGLFVLAG